MLKEYLEMRRDKSCVSTVPQIPQFLLDRVNKTLKMSLKYRSTSLNEAKQTQLPGQQYETEVYI